MRVTEKQLQIMFRVLEGSLRVSDRTDMNIFGYTHDVRSTIWQQIINQQSEEIIDVMKTNNEVTFGYKAIITKEKDK